MYKRLAAATLSVGMLTSPLYSQANIQPPAIEQVSLETQIQQYLKPVQSIFRVDLRAAYEKAKDLFSPQRKGIPNPHPVILHEPVDEIEQQFLLEEMLTVALEDCEDDTCRDEARQKYGIPPVMLDAVEAHMNSLAKFRAQRIADNPHIESMLSRYDPAKGMVRAFDFGSDIQNIQYTTNARIGDSSTGRETDALLAYFEFHPKGQENDLQYRVIAPIEQVTRIEGEEYDYFERSYNKVLGVIQAKRRSDPDTAWKVLDNPMLERMKNNPKRKDTRDPYAPDASQRGPPTMPGERPPGGRP